MYLHSRYLVCQFLRTKNKLKHLHNSDTRCSIIFVMLMLQILFSFYLEANRN